MREVGGNGLVVGLDEVGRGALAGPLAVACVALPDNPQIIGLDDSKKLSPKRRVELAAQIEETALALGIAYIPPQEIDEMGMAASLRAAFSRALLASGVDPDAVLVDGNPLHIHSRERNIIKGDGKVACIAAASIYAKVKRDGLMCQLDKTYPEYGFAQNKGYGTAAHIAAIQAVGPSDQHRKSFLGNILTGQQSLL